MPTDLSITASKRANRRVAVAMSGGVDSSVAAALLVQQGFEVVGLTMKLFDHQTAQVNTSKERGCCNVEAIYRAQAVCHTLDIPHYSLDLIKAFNHYVIDDFVSEYVSGRTPNPCVRCNTHLKWGILYDKSRQYNCDFLAAGHYATIQQEKDEFQLLRAADRTKDQSYALWGIPRERLANTLLPLGGMSKLQVRRIAADLGLKSAQTPESQEICFILEGDYPDYLKQRMPDSSDASKPGEIWEETNGELLLVGSHSGYIFYTVGQRKGLGGGFDEPRYVLRVEPDTNRIIIGRRERLQEKVFFVDQLNWLISPPEKTIPAEVQVRYRSTPVQATLRLVNDQAEVELDQPLEAIAPGQSAVFYQGDRVLGGGRIVRILSPGLNRSVKVQTSLA